jgi:ribosomal protein L16 Arg81 hydroxylase
MLILNPEFLNPEIYQADDRPRVWRNAVTPFVSWQDAEDALNAPWNHVITVIGDDRKRMDLEMVEEPWFYTYVPKKEELFELANAGYTINICKYGHGKPEVDELLSQLENTFDGCADCHIFVTTGANNSHPSFNPHWDKPNNFIIQMEGETRWQVYNERASTLIEDQDHLYLPTDDELSIAIDTVLTPGDVLYFPARAYHNTRHVSGSRLSLSIPIWCPKRGCCSDRNRYTLKVNR